MFGRISLAISARMVREGEGDEVNAALLPEAVVDQGSSDTAREVMVY